MKLELSAALFLLALLPCAAAFATITVETVPVGDVGNPNDSENTVDPNALGGVSTAYNIGKYEVTVGQYTAFLNAVARTDTYGLYNSNMTRDLNIAGISVSGSSGSYTYSPIGSANHPITFVSWGDAARFANWLQNGQPTGAQGPATTETGAYTLNGATSNSALMAIIRNAGAQWVIPTANEWYKAAYYQPTAVGGDSDGYWAYPMKTNSVPYSDQPPGVTPVNTRVGNFYSDDSTANLYNDGYAVTGSTRFSSSQNYLTDVGAYTSSPSYYGTFDQGGNVWEWNETAVDSSTRGVRGGSWGYNSISLSPSYVRHAGPTGELDDMGFRVASIPAPSGDYNGNGVFDAADYVLWRKNPAIFGNAAGYSAWRSHFGQSGGSSATDNGTVPEPSTAALIGLAAIVGLGCLSRERTSAGTCARVRSATSAGITRGSTLTPIESLGRM